MFATKDGKTVIYLRGQFEKALKLAKKLGTSKQFISDMENDRKPISRKTAKELAALFDVSVARFI